MGLDTKTNRLLAEGPIALKSRKDVIINALMYLQKFNKNIEFHDLEDLFVKVHIQFSKIVNEFIIKYKGFEYALEKMNDYKNNALKLLKDFPQNDSNNSIKILLDYIIERKY